MKFASVPRFFGNERTFSRSGQLEPRLHASGCLLPAKGRRKLAGLLANQCLMRLTKGGRNELRAVGALALLTAWFEGARSKTSAGLAGRPIRMSELDQKAKSSVRADVVRFCPESRGVVVTIG
jgi:hypothetical protein